MKFEKNRIPLRFAAFREMQSIPEIQSLEIALAISRDKSEAKRRGLIKENDHGKGIS